MNLLDYVSPPSLDSYQLKKGEFYTSKSILRETTAAKLDLSKVEVALLGAPFAEDNSYDSTFVDSVRLELAKLADVQGNTSILDVGNLIRGKTLNDSLTALKDVLTFLQTYDIFVIVIGDLSLLQKTFMETLEGNQNMKVVEVAPVFSIYDTLDYLSQQTQKRLHYTNIGYQVYYVDQAKFNWLNSNNFDAYRLGEVRKSLPVIEPAIRDSLLINIDLNALKHQEAPSQKEISPNGFYSEELCQIAKYAGAADFLKIANISGFKEIADVHTIKLTAQIIWFIIEGFGIRVTEDPINDIHIKKFNVNSGESNNIVFYKSDKTERWWLEVPLDIKKQSIILPSNYQDYIEACNQQIPKRFLKAIQRYKF